jgi:hypothetical protein
MFFTRHFLKARIIIVINTEKRLFDQLQSCISLA